MMQILNEFCARFNVEMNHKQTRGRLCNDKDYPISITLRDSQTIIYNDYKGRISGIFSNENKSLGGGGDVKKPSRFGVGEGESSAVVALKTDLDLIDCSDFSHAYLDKKGIKSSLFKVNYAGYDSKIYAEFFMFNDAQKLVNTGIESINQAGDKRKIKGSRVGFHAFNQNRTKSKKVALLEGLASAWAYNQLNPEIPALAVGGCSNFEAVAHNLLTFSKIEQLVIVPDFDEIATKKAQDVRARFGAKVIIEALENPQATGWDAWDVWHEQRLKSV